MKETPFPPENRFAMVLPARGIPRPVTARKYAECVAKCKDLLGKAPNFASARNNMAIACFQGGRAKEAVAAVEETRRIRPDNRFAEAMLAKLYFLTGRGDDAHQLADQIVNKPTDPTRFDRHGSGGVGFAGTR